jgi:hypothetical protein
VAQIGVAGERTRAYGYAVVLGIGGAGEMIHGEA